MESGVLIGINIFLFVTIVILIVLYFVFDSQYKDLINNESALCPAANCSVGSSTCGVVPFKLSQSGPVNCAQPNIFSGKVPSVSGV